MNALSLFSGIGGLDIAAEWAGFKTVAFCERDKFCKSVLAARWPNVRIYDDVRTIDTSELPAIELVHGGYPCQPFSTAGEQRGTEDPRHLWPAMLRVVQGLRPAWVVGENVVGHIALGLDAVIRDLEAEGYATRAFCIPACSVGARHKRERVFVVANRANCLRRAQAGRVEGGEATGEGEARGGSLRQGMWSAGDDGPAARGEPDGWKQWATEPELDRMVHGVPHWMDRHRAIGNAVVPQQAYPIFAAIAETYNAGDKRCEASD